MKRKPAKTKKEGTLKENEGAQLISNFDIVLGKEGRMTMRWLECGSGSVHVVGPCPDCYATQGGLLLGTVASSYKGRVTAQCLDCNRSVDYYVDAQEEMIWRLEPVEAKGARVEASKR
jgi:hypothetical protein